MSDVTDDEQGQDDHSLLLFLQQYPILASSSLSPSLAALFTEQIPPALAEPGGPAERALSLFAGGPVFLPILLLEEKPDIFRYMVPFLSTNVSLKVLGSINHAFHAAVDVGITRLHLRIHPTDFKGNTTDFKGNEAPLVARCFPLLTNLSVEAVSFRRGDGLPLEWQRQLLLGDRLPLRLTKLKLGESFRGSEILHFQL